MLRLPKTALVPQNGRTMWCYLKTSCLSLLIKNSQASPCNDIAILCSFIGLIYSILPSEQALQFWGATPLTETHHLTYLEIGETNAGRLPSFLQWGVWSTQTRDVIMTTALYDMLSGLAKGQQCGKLTYNFLTRGGVEVVLAGSLATSSSHCSVSLAASWMLVFALLESWAVPSTSPKSHPPPQQNLGISFSGIRFSHFTEVSSCLPTAAAKIGPDDVLLAQSFLHLLFMVFSCSVVVHLAVSGNMHF
jgi:nuclear pore complex protein Nup205